MLDSVELALLRDLAAAPIARPGSVVRSNLLCKMTKRRNPLAVYVRGFVGKVPVQAYCITEAGRERLAKEGA